MSFKRQFIFIDGVFAVTAAKNAAGNAYFIKIKAEAMVAVVEKTSVTSATPKGLRLPLPGKNNIFHFAAAQIFGALLAQYPADRIRNVALAAAVGSNDCRNARTEA